MNGLAGPASPGGGPAEPDDLVAIVRRRAARTPENVAFSFMDFAADRAGRARAVDYETLDERARAIAATLRRTCAPGDRVAVTCPHGPGYVEAWLGCLYAGCVAVPLPGPERPGQAVRLRGVLADCAPSRVLTTTGVRADVEAALDGAPGAALDAVLCVDRVPTEAAADWSDPPRSPGDLAFLQYTSGSTREPVGVCVSHANLIANVRQIERQSEMDDRSVVVSWLPFFHDMGLISGIVLPLGVGAHAVLFTPMAFLQEPRRWLRLISDYRGTWTAGPDFAFELCVRRIAPDRRRDLDLSSLTGMTDGSEQVRSDGIGAFLDAFVPCGLDPVAVSPGYGLAEATLGVTSADRGAVIRAFDRAELTAGRARPAAPGGRPARELVSCGPPLPEVSVLIVDPDTGAELPPGRIGEVCASGPNITEGYWGRPDLTRAVFADSLAGRPGRWLRTGDMGFLRDGELYVTGRRKELVVVDGRNHAPADVESTVERAHAAIRPGGVAAFAVETADGEGLGVAVELRGGRLDEPVGVVADAVNAVLAAEHGLRAEELVFLRPGRLPRTTSGKIRRAECRTRFAAGGLDPLDSAVIAAVAADGMATDGMVTDGAADGAR
ncbi:fatty acyl-AMP ligase [Actinomadura algeriensis]|uniref:Long chain fatty acid CoA FadD26 n=1 Tax=Actinomadura algeriensis TaxID=1679523 RepID=A0ABR9JIP3_9ACTN|nr:fatty acyl-AMP ligase [Actinomadura algeriensis]MBE1530417.1 long chain fatty acid CoA FadD26 [Actinomadura algeriensis]